MVWQFLDNLKFDTVSLFCNGIKIGQLVLLFKDVTLYNIQFFFNLVWLPCLEKMFQIFLKFRPFRVADMEELPELSTLPTLSYSS